jgi:hypothetical protein
MFSRLLHHKVASAFLRDFDERVTGHILHTYISKPISVEGFHQSKCALLHVFRA